MLKDSTANPLSTRPASPLSVTDQIIETPICMSQAVRHAETATIELFQKPLSTVPKALSPQGTSIALQVINSTPTSHVTVPIAELIFPQIRGTHSTPMAIHMRMGCDGYPTLSFDEREPSYFSPSIYNGSTATADHDYHCRQWSILAQAHDNTLQLFAIPMTFRPKEGVPSGDPSPCEPSFYLTSRWILPGQSIIEEVGFYGDDGKSSLSSGIDSGTGKEGRQSLGMLVRSLEGDMHLCLAKYDEVPWQLVDFNPILIHPDQVGSPCTIQMAARMSMEEDEHDFDPESFVLKAKSKFKHYASVLSFFKLFSFTSYVLQLVVLGLSMILPNTNFFSAEAEG